MPEAKQFSRSPFITFAVIATMGISLILGFGFWIKFNEDKSILDCEITLLKIEI